MEKNIIVIGGHGQLGQCLQEVSAEGAGIYHLIFLSREDLDYREDEQIRHIFEQYNPVYCINCAAYTAVDLAEEDNIAAFNVNEEAVKKLSLHCVNFNTTLIHISTDFVFDGNSNMPLVEDFPASPVNVYGLSKLRGEQAIQKILTNYYILRTSWLYSEKAGNFVKTMLKLSQSKTELSVICDQLGTPTYAVDLAVIILKIIEEDPELYGIYHYSNEGVASWYDFAKAIFEFAKVEIRIIPVASSAFVTKAKRPHYSVLDKSKIKMALGVEIPYWRESLSKCIQNL